VTGLSTRVKERDVEKHFSAEGKVCLLLLKIPFPFSVVGSYRSFALYSKGKNSVGFAPMCIHIVGDINIIKCFFSLVRLKMFVLFLTHGPANLVGLVS